MASIQHVSVAPADPRRFASVLTPADYDALLSLIEQAVPVLDGRVLWNVNSTAKGGGVVELLGPLLSYCRGAGVDARWVVIGGGADFFGMTKRMHNHLHGFDGDGGGIGEAERAVYERTLAENARDLVPLIHEHDLVILHDPQTAGLVEPVAATGATVVWRCHIGLDHPNDRARQAWDFLRPYVAPADAYVFSRAAFAWERLESDKVAVIQPSIDAFAPKNAEQTVEQTQGILSRAGIIEASSDEATFTRTDGSPGRIDRQAELVEAERLRPDQRLVTQISRWDQLKDPLGVLIGFADHTAPSSDVHLLLAGPSPASVADDPEGAAVYSSVCEAWLDLSEEARRRIHLASLPMEDAEENAAIVNAIQRHSYIVVQKSVAEGFGLTVAEAMWKERPVVASRIGGIQDQIVDGVSGVLVSDPRDLREFGAALNGLLADPAGARQMGTAARTQIQEHFLGPHHLARYFELIHRVIGDGRGGGSDQHA